MYVTLHTHRIEMKTLNVCSFYILDRVSRSMNNKNVHFHAKKRKNKNKEKIQKNCFKAQESHRVIVTENPSCPSL